MGPDISCRSTTCIPLLGDFIDFSKDREEMVCDFLIG